MIHVKKDRCGYSGYTCLNRIDIPTALSLRKAVCDDDPERTENTEEAEKAGYSLLDNYLNIPRNLRGLVMRVRRVVDMSADLIPPEVQCSTDTDPFSGGFLNLYRSKYSDRVYDIAFEGSENLPVRRLNCFADPSTREEGIMDPGLLEPVLAAGITPPVIDVPPAADKALDGAIRAIENLNEWKDRIDERIREIDTWLDQIRKLVDDMLNDFKEGLLKDVEDRIKPVEDLIKEISDVVDGILGELEDLKGLKDEIDDIKDEVGDLTETINNINVTINNIQNTVNNISTVINNITNIINDVPDLSADIDNIYNIINNINSVINNIQNTVNNIVTTIQEIKLEITNINQSITELQSWKTVINNTITNISNAFSSTVKTIQDLVQAQQETSPCEQFSIRQTGGDTFSVSGGTAYINGEGKQVSGIGGLKPPFYVYCNIEFSGDGGKGQYASVTATLSTSQSGDISVGIGGVSEGSGVDLSDLKDKVDKIK